MKSVCLLLLLLFYFGPISGKSLHDPLARFLGIRSTFSLRTPAEPANQDEAAKKERYEKFIADYKTLSDSVKEKSDAVSHAKGDCNNEWKDLVDETKKFETFCEDFDCKDNKFCESLGVADKLAEIPKALESAENDPKKREEAAGEVTKQAQEIADTVEGACSGQNFDVEEAQENMRKQDSDNPEEGEGGSSPKSDKPPPNVYTPPPGSEKDEPGVPVTGTYTSDRKTEDVVKHEKAVVYGFKKCPHAIKAKDVLNSLNIAHTDIDLDSLDPAASEKLRKELINLTGFPSVGSPVVFICAKAFNGENDLVTAQKSGDLIKIAQECGLLKG